MIYCIVLFYLNKALNFFFTLKLSFVYVVCCNYVFQYYTYISNNFAHYIYNCEMEGSLTSFEAQHKF